MTEATRCDWFRETAFDYLDGALSRLDLTAFRRHFAECPACSDALRTIEGQAELLTALPRPEPPRDLAERIDRAVTDRRRIDVRPRPLMKWAGLAAAAALLAATLSALASAGPTAPREGPAARTLRVVDVQLPGDSSVLGRLAPSYENPGGSLHGFLVSGAPAK